MNEDIEKLKKVANQLKSAKDRENALADLKAIEESASNLELLKAKTERMEVKAQKSQLYTSLFMLLMAAANCWYIVHSLISGQIRIGRSSHVSFINDPMSFWIIISFYVLFFTMMLFGFITMFPRRFNKRGA